MTDGPVILEAGDARLTMDPVQGGRMTSLVVAGQELLVTEGYGPIRWGCYPMAPFAGRIRDGRFTFRGRDVVLPLNLPPHAIHGTVFERPWTVTRPGQMTIDLGPDWPFAGRLAQEVVLRPDGLIATLRLEADQPMPAVLGWHPWFRWTVRAAAAVLAFEPAVMAERGPDGLPTGRLGAPRPGPWDDAFRDTRTDPRITWPGVLELTITSDAAADWWVVYDASSDGLCVEPQTGPPDAANQPALGPPLVVEPGRPLSLTMGWAWSRLG